MVVCRFFFPLRNSQRLSKTEDTDVLDDNVPLKSAYMSQLFCMRYNEGNMNNFG